MTAEAEGVQELMHWGDGLPCPKCRGVNLPEHAWFASYFESNEVLCDQCQTPFDPWVEAIRNLSEPMPPAWVAFLLIGAVCTQRRIPIPAEKTSELDLSFIPPTAEILHVGITTFTKGATEAFTFPGLVIMNSLQFDPFPRHLFLYGMSHGRENVSTSEAWVTVTWIDPDAEEVSLHHLADAAKQFAAGRYNRMLVSANIAVESALTPALLDWVRRYCGRDDAEAFLGPDGASYSHQLKVLTKISAKAMGIGLMPGRLSNLLDELRRYRNDLVHTGALRNEKRPPPSREKAAEFLAAATFGYHYARHLNARHLKDRATSNHEGGAKAT